MDHRINIKDSDYRQPYGKNRTRLICSKDKLRTFIKDHSYSFGEVREIVREFKTKEEVVVYV